MLRNKLKKYRLVLASGSPRRQQFFKDLDLDFDIRLKEIEEIYPSSLKAEGITNYLAELKANDFEYLRGRILILLPENDIFKKEDQKRFADLFRKLDAEIRTVPGGHVGFIVQAERYLDLMETFLQRNGI